MEHPNGGMGALLGGVPGVDPLNVVILGGGVVGAHAAHMAVGMGADVWVLDNNPETLESALATVWKKHKYCLLYKKLS